MSLSDGFGRETLAGTAISITSLVSEITPLTLERGIAQLSAHSAHHILESVSGRKMFGNVTVPLNVS